MNKLTCRIKDHIQPFERKLALQQIRSLTKSSIVPIDGDDTTALTFAITTTCDTAQLRDALAYWQFVGDDTDGLTLQIRSEATSIVARNGVSTHQLAQAVRLWVPFSLPKKRCLRYGTHGLHEYRGKFFPQLVRALLNIADVPKGGLVLDPMCGSGTTLVEARSSGMRGYGIDSNPLSVFVSDAKCEALGLRPESLVAAHDDLRADLQHISGGNNERWRSLDVADRDYLRRWFAPRVLWELDHLDSAIGRLKSNPIRNFYRVCLSNILREISWQKTDDLRVRREIATRRSGEATARFLKEASRSTRAVVAFLAERGPIDGPAHFVVEGDARSSASTLSSLAGKIDAVVTSPPYATALPYIDTDRLSLIYLELSRRKTHRYLDMIMIGNREITTGKRFEYWDYYVQHKGLLPAITRSMIERIDKLNKNDSVGFRRRNMSALLSRYFFDMRKTLQQMHQLLKFGGCIFLVIGNNRTTAGGEAVEINTADHLAKIGAELGFKLKDGLSMEMLVSRDIFRKNAVRSEQIVRLEKI